MRYFFALLLAAIFCSPVLSQVDINQSDSKSVESIFDPGALLSVQPQLGSSQDVTFDPSLIMLSLSTVEGVYSESPQAQLGVNVQKADGTLSKQLSLPKGVGLVVANVVDQSAAAEAKLEVHDVLLKFEEQWLVNEEQLRAIVGMHQAGEKVRLTVIRAAKQMEVDVVLQLQKQSNRSDIMLHLNHLGAKPFNHASLVQGHDCKSCHVPSNRQVLTLTNFLDPQSNAETKPVDQKNEPNDKELEPSADESDN